MIAKLSEKGATGTVRVNRIEKCPVKSVENLKKELRGSCDFRLDKTSGIIVARWHDNSVVTLASNKFGVQPFRQVSRWSAAEKKRIQVQQPYVIQQYNKFMGGVDRMDQNIGQYRISFRSKKWWWPFFAYCVDVSMQNAWLCYRLTESHARERLDQLQFRRSVCRVYYKLGSSTQQIQVPKSLGRPQSIDRRVPSESRDDGLNHNFVQGSTQRRCALCGKKVTQRCAKCNVGLHIRCFSGFHKKP